MPGWYVDVVTNTVVVLARGGSAAARAFVAASGVDAAAVRVVASTETPRPLYDVRGGDAYYIGGGRCSVGFSVNGGFVTAGHCGTAGHRHPGLQPGRAGHLRRAPRSPATTTPGCGSTPTGPRSRGSTTTAAATSPSPAPTRPRSARRSAGPAPPPAGTAAPSRPRTPTVNYPQGTVTGLTRTNVCAEPGDSGGSLDLRPAGARASPPAARATAPSGGTTYFQPVNEILSAYGLTLRHQRRRQPAATAAAAAGAAGCTGYESTYTGSLSSTGASADQPNGSYYQSTVSGTHRGCLDGPTGVDFDLYLQKWNGVGVGQRGQRHQRRARTRPSRYNGTAGYYRYRVHAYSGSGSYTLGITNP